MEVISTTAVASHFRDVINCSMCNETLCNNLRRDDTENIPQPGFVGHNYADNRILFVGINPKFDPTEVRATKDRQYTGALRTLAATREAGAYQALYREQMSFMPNWPVFRNIPLTECGLNLEDIAYTNAVSCRTSGDKDPSKIVRSNCSSLFKRTLELLDPRVVVFVGVKAESWVSHIVESHGIPYATVNRARHMNKQQRSENRFQVAEVVRKALGTSAGGLWD